jgi:hypothetical protein
MNGNLNANEIYNFITGDFRVCWDSLAANSDPNISRGNFMFGRQAMNLLEFACRLYEADRTGQAGFDFSNQLNKIESRYYTRLPLPTVATRGFTLPNLGNNSGDLLLWSLYDLIRNGLAHQYQQIIVNLNGGQLYFVQITGASAGRTIDYVRNHRPNDHLGYFSDIQGNTGIKIYPEILFLDFENAITNANLLGRNLNFDYLSRPGKSKTYGFSARDLINSLKQSGHTDISASTSGVNVSGTSNIIPP